MALLAPKYGVEALDCESGAVVQVVERRPGRVRYDGGRNPEADVQRGAELHHFVFCKEIAGRKVHPAGLAERLETVEKREPMVSGQNSLGSPKNRTQTRWAPDEDTA